MRKKITIIPSYEPPHSFINYVKDLLCDGVDEVLVVNDGSNKNYDEIYDNLNNIKGCTVIGYENNRGKGYALKMAFAYCKENYSDDYIFVTADCDGQHLAKDVINVAKEADRHPGNLILGARDFNDPGVPIRSRSGNIHTRRAFKFLYKISLSDTQTGLRGFSYSLLDKLLSVSGTRFEYEMNMLIVFHKSHIGIIEVPIETVYNDKPDDVEKVSHFRTVRDSVRVFSTLLKNLGWYMLSSTLSAIVDVLAFYLLFRFAFNGLAPAVVSLLATVIARVISSVINFTFNYKFVFNGQSKVAVFKYYTLWTAQLGLSYGLTVVWNHAFNGIPILVTLFKGLCDLLVALLSYQIQNRWVFVKREHDRLHFWGPFFGFTRTLFNIFKPKYRSFVYPDEKKPCIYVTRHLNLHGPIKVAQSFNFSVHFFVLNYFVDFKKCFKQYNEYTFTARYGKNKSIWSRIKAFFAALYVVPLVRSSKPVTVYRGGNDSIKTFKQAFSFLDKGENLIVFPDKDYTADKDTESEIYSGFLFIDKVYFKKYGEHIDFVVIDVNDEKQTITEVGRTCFKGDMNFNDEMPIISEQIRVLLMKK